jgi:hypothetical protein
LYVDNALPELDLIHIHRALPDPCYRFKLTLLMKMHVIHYISAYLSLTSLQIRSGGSETPIHPTSSTATASENVRNLGSEFNTNFSADMYSTPDESSFWTKATLDAAKEEFASVLTRRKANQGLDVLDGTSISSSMRKELMTIELHSVDATSDKLYYVSDQHTCILPFDLTHTLAASRGKRIS